MSHLTGLSDAQIQLISGHESKKSLEVSTNTCHSNRSTRRTRMRSRVWGSKKGFCGTLRTFIGLTPDTHPDVVAKFIDVTYRQLVPDPMAVERRIYERLDIRLTEVAAERMQRLTSSRSRYQSLLLARPWQIS